MADGWTIETLKEYVDTLLTERQRAVDSAIAAADRAVIKAEAAAEKRFESVNEFRSQLKDQQSGLITRIEAETEFRAIREKIDGLALSVTESRGRGVGFDKSWAILVAAVGLIATLILIWKR